MFKQWLALLVAGMLAACGGGNGAGDEKVDAGPLDVKEAGRVAEVAPDAPGPADTVADRVGEVALEVTVDTVAEVVPPDIAPEMVAEVVEDIVEPPPPDALPFSEGPYGVNSREIAAPFVLPTLAGDWDFQEEWGLGQDSYFFVFKAQGYAYSQELWDSPVKQMLGNGPQNVHYFYLSYNNTAQQDVTQLKERIDAELAELGAENEAYWQDRLHYVPVNAYDLDNWVSDVVKAYGFFAFGIDRFQRLREVGLLMPVLLQNATAQLFHLTYQARAFNFEWDREHALAAADEQFPPTVVTVIDQEQFGGKKKIEVEFPDAETMAGFDHMEFDLTMGCTDHKDDNCGEWDYKSHVFLCLPDDPGDCSVELARWITTYHREGRWVHDVTQGLAFLQEGGTRTLEFNASSQSYLMDFHIKLSHRGKGMRPAQAQWLWGGGPFNLGYNPSKAPITFETPDGVKRVDVYAIISGHGWGSDVANCAEFCNHTHHFTLNGADEYKKTHPMAGTSGGCQLQIEDGTIPNQFGTWPIGRGGWCPGLEVKPFYADITNSLVSGENFIEYKALYKGNDYDPQPAPQPQGFGAQIHLSSWLIFWK